MATIIPIQKSDFFSLELPLIFDTIKKGDVLTIVNKVYIEELPERLPIEHLMFKNENGNIVKLAFSKIIMSKGFGESLRKAIWNKDINFGKDIYDILAGQKLRVDDITYNTKYRPDGTTFISSEYTFTLL